MDPLSGLAIGAAAGLAARGAAWAGRRAADRAAALRALRTRLGAVTVPLNEVGLAPRGERACRGCEELCPGCAGKPSFQGLARLGNGQHAPVYLTRWRGQDVALKVTQFDSLTRFLNEVETMRAVARCPNVVSLVGVNLDSAPMLVYTFAPGQTLHDICRRRARPLPFHLQISIARKIAEAMVCLHRKGVMHRDLKSPNVIVSLRDDEEDCSVELIDFGSARFVDARRRCSIPFHSLSSPLLDIGDDDDGPEGGSPRRGGRRTLMEYLRPEEAFSSKDAAAPRPPDRIVHPARLHCVWRTRAARDDVKTGGVGTFDWMAPEMWGGRYTEKGDVYSFAVVLYELATGHLPWQRETVCDAADGQAGVQRDQELLRREIQEGLRPHLPSGVRRPLQQLIERCWAGAADSRPPFREIAAHLAELEQDRPRWLAEWRALRAQTSWETMDGGM